jgi:hypothetical protein
MVKADVGLDRQPAGESKSLVLADRSSNNSKHQLVGWKKLRRGSFAVVAAARPNPFPSRASSILRDLHD